MSRVVTGLVLTFVLAVPGSSLPGQETPPAFPVPELTGYIPRLARTVELIGLNQVEEALNTLEMETNPAFRNPAALEKFRESWLKLFGPLGQQKMKFETYDIVAYKRVSSQACLLYGTANGTHGPVFFDFRVFRYEGKWNVHSFTFRLSDWKRDPEIADDAVRLPVPVVYPLGQQQVAAAVKPSAAVVRR